MENKKGAAENAIVDYIDDEEFYQTRRHKKEIDNATWAVYIYATVSLMLYIFYLLMNTETFDWLNLAVNLVLIAIYFCLAAYSNHKPFTAFVSLFVVMGLVFILELFLNTQFNLKGLIVKVVLVVYISMRMEAAKAVEDYEKKNTPSAP